MTTKTVINLNQHSVLDVLKSLPESCCKENNDCDV